jgi:beta-galactosidase GanA
MGTEIYWHGILDYDNRDNRKLKEVKEIRQRIQAVSSLAGSSYKAVFGVLTDYDNEWDSDVDVWHRRLARESDKEIFRASQLTHTPMDYVCLQDSTEAAELDRYPLLFYPHPLILTQDRVSLLKTYVEHGGILVIGARTGQKDLTGKCVMQPMPGLLRCLTHTNVREFTFIGPADEPQSMCWMGAHLLPSTGKEKRLPTTAIAQKTLAITNFFVCVSISVYLRFDGLMLGAQGVDCCAQGHSHQHGGQGTADGQVGLHEQAVEQEAN